MTETNEKCFNITWYINCLRIGRRSASVGFCSLGNGIAFVEYNLFWPFFIRGVYVNEVTKKCEFEERCFNIKCPYNKADPKKFKLKSFEEVKKAHALLEKISKMLEIEPKEDGVFVSFKIPPVRIGSK